MKKIILFLTVLFASVYQTTKANESDIILQRLKDVLITFNDTTHIRQLHEEMLNDGSWSSINYEDKANANWQPYTHLTNLQDMAMGYQDSTYSLFHDKGLLQSIRQGLIFWYDNKIVSRNWWYNKIGKQHCLAKIAIVMQKDLPIRFTNQIVDELSTTTEDFTAQNLIWLAEEIVWKGLLTKDTTLIQKGVHALQAVAVTSYTEGVMPDNSFRQHGPQLYSGGSGYGADFIYSNILWTYCLRETPFQFSAANIKTLSNYLLDGCRWMIMHKYWDFETAGRTFVRKGSLNAQLMSNYLSLFAKVDKSNNQQYLDFINHIEENKESLLVGNKVFHWSDYIVHRKKNYFFSVRMNSVRTYRTENGNKENVKGYYLADGCTNISVYGNEYESVFPSWNWTKLPGVTSRLMKDPPPFKSWGVPGNTSFVGGVSDGKTGIGVYDMDFDSIQVKKAWFMLEQEIVCMVSGLNHSTDDTLITTLNQTMRSGNIWIEPVGANGSIIKKENLNSTLNAKKIWHNQIGYLIPNKETVRLISEKRLGDWRDIGSYKSPMYANQVVFELTRIHADTDESFTYMIVPGIEVKAFKTYQPSVKIIRNDTVVQAIYHTRSHTYYLVMHQPQTIILGEKLTLYVDKPCLVMIKEYKKKLRLYLADPTQKCQQIQVKMIYKNCLAEKIVTMPSFPEAGETIQVISDYLPGLHRLKKSVDLGKMPF